MSTFSGYIKKQFGPLKELVQHKTGYRIVRNETFEGGNNFTRLADSYEQLFNETYAHEHPIPPNPLRLQLMARLLGTQPSEAYFIIKSIVATAAIEGDVCEFGVAQGETSAVIANEIFGSSKNFHLFDSFEGLPQPTEKDELKDDIFALGSMDAYAGMMSVPIDLVKARLKDVGFPDNRYVIHKGYFENLIAEKMDFPSKVSFAYVDFDFYEPIKLVLSYLDSVAPQGAQFVVDDYDHFSTGAKSAVDEFIAEKNVEGERYTLFIPHPRYGHFAVLYKRF